jgi:orotate phosphoribosyltransferase
MESEFASFLLSKGALKIAQEQTDYFLLKSGRRSPVFLNMGSLIDGESLSMLAQSYAEKIFSLLQSKKMDDFDFIFGPAYKGIPLAALTCAQLWSKYKIRKKFLYNRKEAKLHGDVKADQVIVGADQFVEGSKILMIDDVISTGGAKFEAWEIAKKFLPSAVLVGVIVAVDRQECAGDANTALPTSAAEEVENRLGCPLFSIATMGELYKSLLPKLTKKQADGWRKYFEKWGSKEAKRWLEDG